MNRLVIINLFRTRCNSFMARHTTRYASIDTTKQSDKKIPIYKSKFRMAYSPLYWQINHNAFDRIFSLAYPHEMRNTKKCCYGCVGGLVTSLMLPFTIDVKRLVTLTEFICCLVMTDDYIGVEKSKQGLEDLIRALNGTKIPEKPNEHLIHLVNEIVRPLCTDAQYKRYLDETRIFFEVCAKEIEFTRPIITFDDVIEFRELTIAVNPVLALTPYAMGIDVTEFYENPILKQMELLVIKQIIMINDIYSTNKEIAAQESENYNTFRFLLKQYNDFDKALKQIFELIDSYEEEFLKLKLTLEKQYPNAKDMHEYMKAMEFMSGSIPAFQTFCPRYNKFNRYSLKDDIFYDRFPELIAEVERNEILMYS